MDKIGKLMGIKGAIGKMRSGRKRKAAGMSAEQLASFAKKISAMRKKK